MTVQETTTLRIESEAALAGDSLLIGLAILRANWDRHEQTFIDNFIPFVADCLRDLDEGTAATPAEVQSRVKKRYGIDLPQGALKTVLNRTVKRGLATRSKGAFRPNRRALEGVPLARRREDAAREIESLITRMVAYLQEAHGETWTRERTEAALRSFVEAWSIPLLRQSLNGEKYEEDGSGREEDYLVGGFVMHLRHQDPEGFRYLESLVKGSMLTAGLYLDQGRFDQSFKQLTAYFDSPFLLSLFGVHGDEERAAAEELVQLAVDLGVEVACFPDTLSEVRGVLQATARDLRHGARANSRRVHHRVATDGLSASQLEELADRTDQFLTRHGIKLRQRPEATRTGTPDMEGLAAALQDAVGYGSKATREHDVDCLAAVHEIRQGQVQVQIERARAIFITSNPRVVAAATRHFCSARDALQVPVAMMDHAFATLLWLKKPTAAPDLPWKQLIADCHAALNPDDLLWNRYLDEIDALAERDDIDEQSYLLARNGTEARAALMEHTRGRSDRLDDSSVHEIVERAKDAVRAPADARAADAERRAHEAEAHSQQLAERSTAALAEAERRAAVQTTSQAAFVLARRLSVAVTRVLYAVIVAVVVIAMVAGISGILGWAVPRWAAVLSASVLGVGAATLTLFGVSVPQFVGRVEASLVQYLQPRLAGVLSPASSGEEELSPLIAPETTEGRDSAAA